MVRRSCLLFLLVVQLSLVWSNQPVVKTPLGDVTGYFMKTRGGRQISAFTAIPYAVPPLGELRFKAPVPVSPWKNILQATKETPKCMQRNPYVRQKEIVGQEDCLYLNIYSPYTFDPQNDNEVERKPLPVMFWIHGGGWMCGSSDTDSYGPEYLLDRDVLLVTTNYRLGPIGFLSTRDTDCPGNNGLKDQQEALRFIQKTIHSFGGDNQSVTIFGESAGGASVHYHMLSETSQGLFHKAISESGTAMVPWAWSTPGEARRNAFRLAKLMNCPFAPTARMLDCLRSKDIYDIINTEFQLYSWDYEPMTPFKAVVEPEHGQAFLNRDIRKIPRVEATPWMTGLNRDEGCLKSLWITTNKTLLEEFKSGLDTILPVSFYYETSPCADEITKKIKDKYLSGSRSEDIDTGILEMYSDSYFNYPLVEGVELTLNYSTNSVYLYELAHEAANTFAQIFGAPDSQGYICHADELMYLFPIHFLSRAPAPEDIQMSELIVTLFTNFATSGNPNKPKEIPFKWEPATSSAKMEYLELGANVMKQDLASRSRFWEDLQHCPSTKRDEL